MPLGALLASAADEYTVMRVRDTSGRVYRTFFSYIIHRSVLCADFVDRGGGG